LAGASGSIVNFFSRTFSPMSRVTTTFSTAALPVFSTSITTGTEPPVYAGIQPVGRRNCLIFTGGAISIFGRPEISGCALLVAAIAVTISPTTVLIMKERIVVFLWLGRSARLVPSPKR